MGPREVAAIRAPEWGQNDLPGWVRGRLSGAGSGCRPGAGWRCQNHVYLNDELEALWRASGLTLPEVIRLGLEDTSGPGVDVETFRRVFREELTAKMACHPHAPIAPLSVADCE